MKKFTAIILSLTMLLILASCGKRNSFDITITIPAGSTDEYVYASGEISPTKDVIVISSVENASDTTVVLKQVNGNCKHTCLATNKPTKLNVEKDSWFKLGVTVQNPTDEDMYITINIKNIEARIE